MLFVPRSICETLRHLHAHGVTHLIIFIFAVVFTESAFGQTPSTGALIGTIFDLTGAVLPGASISLTDQRTNSTKSTTSDITGDFVFPLLSPGIYEIQVEKTGYALLHADVSIPVTETVRLNLYLRPATIHERAEVVSATSMLQTESPALGRVVNQTAVSNLPLVTRNFTQIVGLSPGVSTGVNNAGELGLGGGGLSQIDKSNDGIFVHGARSYDNNFQIDGLSVSDVQGTGAASGGVPIPNPDAIQEFKVQTALYDASYGRYAGANISVITRTGSNAYHGDMFEFLRNDVLNADDFFANRTGQRRPSLKQNQFGFDIGGPIKKEKVLFFGSYQGTRQVNGIAAGQARTGCTASLSSPPLTNDRSAAALGKLFAGMKGALGGVAVKSDGSNINPVAIALLNFKLPDGTFLIPTPQTIDPTKSFATQGFSFLSQPCSFNEDQFLTNLDYLRSQTSRIAARFFFADDIQLVTFPGNAINPVGNIPGFAGVSNSGSRVFSLSHTYTPNSSWLNEARIGYFRLRTSTVSQAPFKWSDIGVAEGGMNSENELPSLNILGSASIASAFPRTITQNTFALIDNVSLVRGKHTLRFGGSVSRVEDNLNIVGLGSFLQFLSWPDFLLGLSAAGNGTGTFSNVFASVDDFGLLNREYRAWEGSAFGQDDYRIGKTLTINLGLRYERLGQFADMLGRNSNFDIRKADPNPPPAGTVAGYVVASNFQGTIPPGVTRADNPFATDAAGQNSWAPRLGFSWRIFPRLSSFVLRGGYGIYFSRPTGQSFSVAASGPPFSVVRQNVGTADATATFQIPFPQPFPTAASFPQFPSYSPTTAVSIVSISPRFRPSMIQQFGLNIQAELRASLLLEVGYVGARGTHLLRTRSANEALDASSALPIRGQITDTVANIPLRVPIQGVPPQSLFITESAGNSWYNGLEVSLTKHLSQGVQFLASYTFSKTLDTDGANINGTSAGNTNTLGDQNSPGQRWGRASFDRTHRFVFSATYSLPTPERGLKHSLFGGWALASVVTVQSGTALTFAYTNATNVFGITGDRAQLAAGCTKSQLVTPGSVNSKLNDYFNFSCFTTPPVIGADGIGTAFGDSGTGIVNGPGQANVDFSLSKTTGLPWPREGSALQFRAEFFNALNHPQFANPDTQFGSPTFGVISSTSVNARIGQLAIKFSF
jgi:Carboxypeptidase regulatory-like domain/TonB dependent receptor/TonB-dependent Receptor Plug Domain